MTIPLTILAELCPDCTFGKNCKSPAIVSFQDGGISCENYNPIPEPKKRMSKNHVLALPDRAPCKQCASVKGTQANLTPHTMANFNMCVEQQQPFLCHDTGAGRICAGWLKAVKARINAQ